MTQLPITTPEGVELRECETYRGVLCRADTMDRYVVQECWRSYKTLPVKDRRCMDIGANIGAWTRYAIANGARSVVCLEPEQSNWKCLFENTTHHKGKVTLYNACAGTDDGQTTLWLSPTGKNSGNTSQKERRGRFSQDARVDNVHELMRLHEIESVKIDCEGGEYVVGWPHLMPESVRDVAGEMHVNDAELRESCERLARAYIEAGWTAVVAPRVKTGAWNTLFHYTR